LNEERRQRGAAGGAGAVGGMKEQWRMEEQGDTETETNLVLVPA